MTQKRKARRTRTGIEPRQLYLHHLEEAATHLTAARQVLIDADSPRVADLEALQKIGKNLATLYRRIGGNPDATT